MYLIQITTSFPYPLGYGASKTQGNYWEDLKILIRPHLEQVADSQQYLEPSNQTTPSNLCLQKN